MLILKNKEIFAELIMSINVRNARADDLIRALTRMTKQSITKIIVDALQEKLNKEQNRRLAPHLKEEILTIAHRCAHLPMIDSRTPEDILGYNQDGIPE